MTERLVLKGLAPSVNHMYRNAKVGKRAVKVLSTNAEIWKNYTVLTTKQWRLKNKWSTTNRKVIVRLWFYFPDNRKRDTHNGLKLLLDALEDARIYENDRNALPRVMDFEIDKDNPRIEIEFEAI